MKSNGRRDLAILGSVTFLAFFLAHQVSVPEGALAFFRKDGPWGWDRFLVSFAVLALGLALFATRRFRDLRRETHAREAVELALRQAQEALHVQLEARTLKLNESFVTLENETTQRIRAERELRASEAKYRELLENANDLIHIVSPEGNVIYTNRAWRDAMGFSEEELDLVTFLDLVSPESRADAAAVFHRSLLDGIPTHMELTLLAKSGRRVVLEGTTTWKHADGKPAAGQGVFRDITERRQNERRLQAQYAVARTLADSATLEEAAPRIIRSLCTWLEWDLGAIWTADEDGNVLRCIEIGCSKGTASGPFVEATRKASFARGQSLVGRVWSYAAPAWREELQKDEGFERSEEARGAGLHTAFVFPILVRSGVLGVVEFFTSERREPDVVLLAMAASLGSQIGQFLERKRAEEGLRITKEAAEAANRAKSQFLATMSHELRTPLNSVIGFANILLRNKAKNLTPNDQVFLGRISENGKHLLGLINKVLDLSKIEAGKVELERSVVPLGDLVRKTLQYCEGQARERAVRLVAEVPSGETLLETDSEKLKQILINLIGNALKFTTKGNVTVRIVCDEITGRPSRIDVADTGIGIPKERQKAIFEAFQQADNSTARKYGGTGLGLTISRSLCTLLGYALDLESEPGKGSTFRIHLDGPVEASTDRDVPAEREFAQEKGIPCLN